MVKRGSITVFLALTLGLILSLLSSGLESARMAAARTQILNGMDIGLYSLFGQYDKSLLKDFDLFAVDGACGGKEMNLASIYDNLESYMKPVMKQNSQKLSVQQGGISGYLLMTDSEGEVFYQQAVQYMKETLGSHGAKLLLNKIQDMQKKTIEAERQGNEIESKGTIENYESEMDTARFLAVTHSGLSLYVRQPLSAAEHSCLLPIDSDKPRGIYGTSETFSMLHIHCSKLSSSRNIYNSVRRSG